MLCLCCCVYNIKELLYNKVKKYHKKGEFPSLYSSFWPGLGLPSQRPMLSFQKINPCQNIYGKKTSKSAKYRLPLRYKKDPLK